MISRILLVICLLHGAEQVLSETEAFGDLTFECDAGWKIWNTNCYKFEKYPLRLEEASNACMRLGGWLYYPQDQEEYVKFVGKNWPQKIWFGVAQWSVNEWYLFPTETPIDFIAGWGSNEPNKDIGSTSVGNGIAVSQEEYLTITHENDRLPFVCKRRACLQDYKSCDLSTKCIPDSKICDGKPDCDDGFDERDCSQYGRWYLMKTDTSGVITTGIVTGNVNKKWTLEVPVGRRIKLTVPSTTIEQNVAFLEIRSGSQTSQYSEILETMTGRIEAHSIYSVNNFMIVSLTSQQLTRSSPSITITWTTDIQEIPMEPVALGASMSFQTLTMPFSTAAVPPRYLELEWKISTNDGDIITYYLEITPNSGYKEDDVDYDIKVDGMMVEPKHYYMSSTNVIKVTSTSVPENGMVVLKYKTGCSLQILDTIGYITSPRPLIPNNINCEWLLTGGIPLQRGMTLRFFELNLNVDNRTDFKKKSEDKFSINVYDGNDPITNVNQYMTDDDIIVAPHGNATVVFTSDEALQSGPFTILFSTDCEDLDLLAEKTSDQSYLNKTVTLSCPDGQKFDSEKYKDSPYIDVTCQSGGWIIEEDKSDCIPECQIVYCGVPPKIDNGVLKYVSDVVSDSIATYECNAGFVMTGGENATCDTSGEWINVPACTSSSCPSLNSAFLDNGMFDIVAGTDFSGSANADFNTVIKFSCDDGFELVGPLLSHCNENGWTHTANPLACIRITCPIYPVPHSDMPVASSDMPVEFEGTLTVQCDDGYRFSEGLATVPATITCQANGTFDIHLECEDIDECSESPEVCNNETTTCENSGGSYMCLCKDGFQPSTSDDSTCDDIDECDDDNGGCDDECINTAPGYSCSCNAEGYELYMHDGFQGFDLHPTEDGRKPGDVYRINHSCVPLMCPALEDVDNGIYLSSASMYHFDDTVELQCYDGYKVDELNGDQTSVSLSCNSSGQWDQLYTCTARQCLSPDGSLKNFGETYSIDCVLAYNKPVTYSAKCIYVNGDVEFAGEDITSCPDIDCGDPMDSPVWPANGIFVGDTGPSSTIFNQTGSEFEFGCAPGFTISGESGSSDTTVKCTANGHWDLGTLTCSGKRCSDPGTPADAVQVASQYEVNSVLKYTCTREGYEITGPANYTCEYDETTDTAAWSDDLVNNLPTCEDAEDPTITNTDCGGTLRLNYMDRLSFELPEANDNFAIKSWTTTDHVRSGDYITEEITVTYTVSDFSGMTASCSYHFDPIDRTVKPTLMCPDRHSILVSDTTTMEFNITGEVTVTGGSIKDTTPSSGVITYNHENIGTYELVEVTAANDDLTESYCSFMVYFVANACFEDELFVDVNADRSCTDDGGVLTCESTCKSGYVYASGEMSQNFTCSGTGDWNYAVGAISPNQRYCLVIEYPRYEVTASVTYSYSNFNFDCGTNFQTKMTSSSGEFESNLRNACNENGWNVDFASGEGFGHAEFIAEFQLTVESTTSSSPVDCISSLSNDIFQPESNTLLCGGSGAITVKSVDTNQPELTCISSGYYQINLVSNNETVCVPRGPGEISNGDNPQSCADGTYQDEFGQQECKTCEGTKSPNNDKTGCLDTCPPGYTSSDGFFPCSPCPVDQYWVNKTQCEVCPDASSTVGKDAVTSSDLCYEPCSAGTYSRTGYNVPAEGGCTACPVNFYQDDVGQRTCIRCAVDRTTAGEGSTHSDNCTSINEVCNRTFCSDHGECSFQYHRRVCACDEGYHGDRCENVYHICLGNPCNNGATCNSGMGYDNYTCTCATDYDECTMNVTSTSQTGTLLDDKHLIVYSTQRYSLEECKTKCIENADCLEASWSRLGSNTLCVLYNYNLPETDLESDDGVDEAAFMIKTCVYGFGGDHCEIDTKNECDTKGCHEDSACWDMIGEAECICPESGVYSGPLCDDSRDPCSPNPCAHGTCTSQGSVRYTCECDAGYVGYNCDVNEDYCGDHPYLCAYGGTCVDQLPGSNVEFICECPGGFTGPYCDITPDFCSGHDCDGDNVCYSSLDEMDGVCNCDTDYFEPALAYYCNRTTAPCDTPGVNCNNGTCHNTDDNLSYECECNEGFTGQWCQHNIDDCQDNPCQHGGTCTDLVSAYQCDCTPWYSGDSCENDVDLCASVNCSGNGDCERLGDGYQCVCDAGFTGANCEINIDECASFPCRHNGTCVDGTNAYFCTCPAGWVGDECTEIDDHCSNINCNDAGYCYNLPEYGFCRCEGGALGENCENATEVCSLMEDIDVCINNGACINTGGSAECSCSINFVGNSCELVKDWCSDSSNPCQNGGECVCSNPYGYSCNCKPGYHGVDCQIIEDPCDSNPCHDGATCQSTPTEYICQCTSGKTWTGDSCKETNTDYVLLVNSYNKQAPPMLKSSYSLVTDELSVIVKFRVHSFKESSDDRSLLTIVGTPSLYPMFDADIGNDFWLAINEAGIYLAFDDIVVAEVDFLRDVTLNVNDGNWHGVGVSINSEGYMSATIDSVTVKDPVYIDRNLSLKYNAQHYLGYGYNAEFMHVSVWDRVLTPADFIAARYDDFDPDYDPIQGFWNYDINYATTVLSGQLDYRILGDVNLISPGLNCTHLEDISFVSTGRLTSLQDVSEFDTAYTAIKNDLDDNTVDIAHTLPADLTPGTHPMVIVGKDPVTGLYAECREVLYIKYAETCPAVEKDDSVDFDCSVMQYDCSASCQDPALMLPAPIPESMSCNMLGLWDSAKPYSTIVLPSCVEPQSPEYLVTARMKYDLNYDCEALFTPEITTSLIAGLNGDLVELNNDWPGLCVGDGNECSNVELGESACGADNNEDKVFNVILSVRLTSMTITSGGSSFGLIDALRIIILVEEDIDISNYGNAVLQRESVEISMQVVCPTGHAYIADSCVPCSAGWYLDEESDVCKPCDYDYYQPSAGQTECLQCADGKSTYKQGSRLETDCKDTCEKGYKYDNDADVCVPCPRHYYQDEEGKHFCLPCRKEYKTVGNGSDSETDCLADCPAGFERDSENDPCMPCARGTWRSLSWDDCQSCPENKTTFAGAIADSVDKCQMDICELGQFYNTTSDMCEDCAVGFYQDEMYMTECKACSGNLTTMSTGTVNETDCMFYCPSGYEVAMGDDDRCEPCPRGFFKDNSDGLFGDCVPCGDPARTTNAQASTSASDCSIPKCVQGQYITANNECADCDMDEYSDVELPDTSTECIPCGQCDDCDGLYGTMATGSNSTQCQRYCPEGSSLERDDCVPCARGTYKDADNRFGDCEPCTAGQTTEDIGSTMESNCSIPICSAGQYIDGVTCTPCPLDTYLDIDEPTSDDQCIACGERELCIDYGTMETGSNSSSLCLPVCPAGQYVDGTECVMCPIGQFKPESERFATNCSQCVEGYVTEEEGAISADSCTLRDCAAGFKIVGDDCEPCPEGQFQNESRKDFCYECGENLNTDGTGKASSTDCQISCGPGLHGTEVCVPCDFGFVKNVSGYADCTPCETDSTSNDERTECSIVYCSLGKEFNPATNECEECQLHFYKNELGNDQTCQQCDAGFTTTGTGQSSCTEPFCIPGHYLDENDECVPCLLGTYKATDGNEACTDCRFGFTTSGLGSTSANQCTIVVCPAGQFRVTEDNVCNDCPVNTYQSNSGMTDCTECPDGKITLEDEQTSVDACIPLCEAGYQYNATIIDCDLCPPGTYKPSAGNMEDCTMCPPDKTTIGGGKVSESDCSQDLCQPGTFYDVENGVVNCKPCDFGRYSDQDNMRTCRECPNGNTTRYTGSRSLSQCIDDCPEGFGYSNTDEECYPCPIDQYNDKSGRNPTLCKSCPENFTNTVSQSTTCAFPSSDAKVFNPVDVSVVVQFDISIDSCDSTIGINTNVGVIDDMIVELFVQQRGRYSDDLGLCNEACENIVTEYDSCEVNAQSSHTISVEVTFQQIRDFVTDDGEYVPTNQVIAEILTLHTDALDDVARNILFVGFSGLHYIDVCTPGQQRVNDTCVDCEPGYFSSDGLSCTICPLDKYQGSSKQTSCQDCPDNTYTESTGSLYITDCIEICPAGKYHIADTKTCEDCPLGKYKESAGNDKACDSCPDGVSTPNIGATSADQCTESICLAGQYRDSIDDRCKSCAIGTYSDVINAVECTRCPPDTTTTLTGSKSSDQCVQNCAEGNGFSYPQMVCEPCKVGFFNDRAGSNPNLCRKCPPGQFTQQTGQSACRDNPDDPGTALIVNPVTITIRVKYEVALDSCSDSTTLSVLRTSISFKLRATLWNRARGRFNSNRSFCTAECANVDVAFSATTNLVKSCQTINNRRKRELTHELSLDVVFYNVNDTVQEGDDLLPTEQVVSQILATDDLTVDENTVYAGAAAPIVLPVCENGEQINVNVCEPCPAGYYSDDDSVCKKCPVDTYQNETGQSSCVSCPSLTLNDDTGSNSSAACRSYCELNPRYCNERGECVETGRRSAKCTCNDGYEGEQCQTRSEPDSSLDVIIGASIGGGGGLLVIILIIIACWKFSSNQEQKKTKRRFIDPEYPAMYDNPSVYPMRSQLAPYQTVGYPAYGYKPDVSQDGGSQLDPYRIERASIQAEEDIQPQFVWKA